MASSSSTSTAVRRSSTSRSEDRCARAAAPALRRHLVMASVSSARESASLPQTLCQTAGAPHPQPSVVSSSALSSDPYEHDEKSATRDVAVALAPDASPSARQRLVVERLCDVLAKSTTKCGAAFTEVWGWGSPNVSTRDVKPRRILSRRRNGARTTRRCRSATRASVEQSEGLE